MTRPERAYTRLVAKSKDVTREQAERKKAQAAAFMERIGEPDRADEFDSMSVDEYAEHKGLRLTNPSRNCQRRHLKMARPSNSDLQDQLDTIADILSDAYDPESSREDLATAIGEALDTINGDDEEDAEEDSESDSDDEDSD